MSVAHHEATQVWSSETMNVKVGFARGFTACLVAQQARANPVAAIPG